MLTNNHSEIELEELIKLSGKYLSYSEFIEMIPPTLAEQINSNEFYRICGGKTKGKTVRKFKKQFDKADREFKWRRNQVLEMLAFQFDVEEEG